MGVKIVSERLLIFQSQLRMSIPPFDDNGNLPPEIYYCTWEEFVERFQINPRRSRLIQGLKKAIVQLKAAGCQTIYINGSFVTDKLNPGDFDACWDIEGVNIDYLRKNAPVLLNHYDQRSAQKSKYGGEFFPCEWVVDEFGTTAFYLFQVDINSNRKGIIAIDLREWQI